MGDKQGESVDLMSLHPQQLVQLKNSVQEDVQNLTNSFRSLKGAASRYNETKNSLKTISKVEKDNEILVPLTASLYCPARIEDNEKVLLDIGTDFYAERSIDQANEFVDRKLKLVGKNLENISANVEQKQKILEMIGMVMSVKSSQK